MADEKPNQPAGAASDGEPPRDARSLSELVVEVSERGSLLLREEIELAKAEVAEKVGKLVRGSVVGIAAGIFAFLALILVMEGVAWLLNEEVFDGKVWPGFFIEAALFLLIAALAGLLAYRAVRAGSPPMPEQAIAEAKLTKETLAGDGAAAAASVPPQAGADAAKAASPGPTPPKEAK